MQRSSLVWKHKYGQRVLYRYVNNQRKCIGRVEPSDDGSSRSMAILLAAPAIPLGSEWTINKDRATRSCLDDIEAVFSLLRALTPNFSEVLAAIDVAVKTNALRTADEIARRHGISLCPDCGVMGAYIVKSRCSGRNVCSLCEEYGG